MTRPFLALTMITIGLPDFPQTVCNRDEVAAVSVIPAKGERQRRIVHLCIWNLESGIWNLVPRELLAKAMKAGGKAETDRFYAQHLGEVESVQDDAVAEARRTHIAILDEEALLTTLDYVDLNPVAANMAKTPEESDHTSIKARVDHCREQGTLTAVVGPPADRTKHDQPQEAESFWLVPIEDRREVGGTRAGISASMNLAGYLRLLDWSSRLLRSGKARVPKDMAGILQRLGSSSDLWQHRMEKLRDRSHIFGTVFATKRADINRLAETRGVRKLSNLNGLPRLTGDRLRSRVACRWHLKAPQPVANCESPAQAQ